jgi:hypothetical protein
MSGHAANEEPFAPATLFRVMQAAIGEGLKERFEPPQKMSHQLFVLMMQMNDRARRERAQAEEAKRAKQAKTKQAKTKARKANAGKRQASLPAT